MNYSELSLEERMRYAEEYVLILNDEIKLPAQVISELSKTFFLSAEEAGTAYKNAQQKYRPAFTASTRRKRVYALVLFLVSSTIGLFYVFMSKEPGFGWIDTVGYFFLVTAVTWLYYLIKLFSGKKTP